MAKPFKYLTVAKAGTPRPPAFGGDEFYPEMIGENMPLMHHQAGRTAETSGIWKDGIYAKFEIDVPKVVEEMVNKRANQTKANVTLAQSKRSPLIGSDENNPYVLEYWFIHLQSEGERPARQVLFTRTGYFLCSCQNYLANNHYCYHVRQVLSIKQFAKLCLANRSKFPSWNPPPGRDYSRFAFLETE